MKNWVFKLIGSRIRKLLTISYLVFGGFSIFITVLYISLPDLPIIGWGGFAGIIVVSLLIAFMQTRPKTTISRQFNIPDIKITVTSGDLFGEEGHLVIGMNDVFDTEIGEIISKRSVQGQFLEKVYEGNTKRLDKDIKESLLEYDMTPVKDASKKLGKNDRYPIGTTAVLSGSGNKYFCCAYSSMNADCVASSTIGNVQSALEQLWQCVRNKGEQKTLSMPVIGLGLSRITGITYTDSIKLVLMSFLYYSRLSPITKDFRIVIGDNDFNKIDMLELENFIENL